MADQKKAPPMKKAAPQAGAPTAVQTMAAAAFTAAQVLAPETELRLLHGAAAATLIYGDTGAGKTTLLATFAKWVWKKFHAPTRLVAADPGGYSDDVLALVRLGIIEVWRIYTRDPEGQKGLPSETLVRACQGWWPIEIDPATGQCPLGVPISAPSPDQRFAIAFDGLSGMQEWSMTDMGHRAAQGTLGGEGSNMKTVQSGDLKLGVGNRASVGFTQGKARDWVLSSLSIPNLVCPPVFTALELKVLDSDTKLPLYGPKIAGQAKTTDVPAWFGATLGVCIARDEKGRPQWRLYLRDYYYPDGDRTPHKAKIRASAALPTEELAKLPDYLADAADDPPLTRFNLGYLFDTLEEIRRGTLDRAAAEFPDAPGLKPSTIGTGQKVAPRGPGGPGGPPPLKKPAVPAAVPPAVVKVETLHEVGGQGIDDVIAAAQKKEAADAQKPAPAPAAPTPPPPVAPAPPAPVAPATARPALAGPPAAPGTRPSPAGPRPVQRAPIAAAPAGPAGAAGPAGPAVARPAGPPPGVRRP